MNEAGPRVDRKLDLKFTGDWGQANFHRICSWLTQEVCDRAAAGSRTAIFSLRDGDLDSVRQVASGEIESPLVRSICAWRHPLC